MEAQVSLSNIGPQPHRKEAPDSTKFKDIPIEMVSQTGSMLEWIESSGCRVSERTFRMFAILGNEIPREYRHPTFRLSSVAGLGFPDGAYREEIYVQASRYGLFACSHVDAAFLAAHYLQQPVSQRIIIATRKLKDENGGTRILELANGVSGRCFGAIRGPIDNFWLTEAQFVFRNA